MTHWLRKTHPASEIAQKIAGKIEDADERIANLKEQILAVQARREELEEEAHSIASDRLDEEALARAMAQNEGPALAGCKASAAILQADIRRLFVEATPFLGELAQREMEKAQSIHENMSRWQSRI